MPVLSLSVSLHVYFAFLITHHVLNTCCVHHTFFTCSVSVSHLSFRCRYFVFPPSHFASYLRPK